MRHDPIRFDRLTKSLAAVSSRRRALRLAAGLLGGAALAAARPKTAFACDAGQCFFPFSDGGVCGDCSGCTGDGVCIQSGTCMHCNGPCEPRNDGLVGCGAGQPNCVNISVSCTLGSGALTCCSCPDGYISCQDKCIQKCGVAQTLNAATCSCECASGKTKCGQSCLDATAVCCNPDGFGGYGGYCVVATQGRCCGNGCCKSGCARNGTRCGGKPSCGSDWLGKNQVCCKTNTGAFPCRKGYCKSGVCTKSSSAARSAGERAAPPSGSSTRHRAGPLRGLGTTTQPDHRAKADRKRSSGDGGANGRIASTGT